MKHIDLEAFAALAPGLRRPHHRRYYAMYSSVWDGLVTEPALMTLPLDDHMVHRGDGVFEAMKYVDGALYNLHAHLERLRHSALALHLAFPVPAADIARIAVETARAGGERNGMLRLYVSRGPGSFDVNPYSTCGSQLYVVASAAVPSFMDLHPQGAALGISAVAPKPPAMARVKSCNYLQNMWMKKEAVDRGLDTVVACDEQGFMREGATENIGIVTRERALLFPDPQRMLLGTTMERTLELARPLVADGRLAAAEHREITRADMDEAREILVVGTTWDVSMAHQFEGRPVGDGQPGPIYRTLRQRLLDDIHHNSALRTEIRE
jgi:4-amino-4-deoxychorismate lyase